MRAQRMALSSSILATASYKQSSTSFTLLVQYDVFDIHATCAVGCATGWPGSSHDQGMPHEQSLGGQVFVRPKTDVKPDVKSIYQSNC